LAAQLGIHPDTVKVWQRAGLLHSQVCNDKGEHLYEPPGKGTLIRYQQKFKRSQTAEIATDVVNEVQSGA
jgi:DNA-binding transcriptional MerR regulator